MRQEAARYRIFDAATNAAEATDEADDENYFAVLDQAGMSVKMGTFREFQLYMVWLQIWHLA